MHNKRMFDGIRIADFSWMFAGPIVTKFMADYGAEVIKIESPSRPDDVRTVGPFRNNKAGNNRSATFALYNSSKCSVTLDLRNKEAVEIAKKIIAKSDIVVESFRAGVIDKLGLGYSELRKIKKDIIMLSCTIYGQTGPASVQAMLGTFFQSEVGITNFIGWPDRSPVVVPNPYTDYIEPWFALATVLAALDYRRKKGKGQYIDISQIETTPHFLGPQLMDYIVNKKEQIRAGNRCEYASPHGVFRCIGKDRWCAIAVSDSEEWLGFCNAIGNPSWVKDEKFSTFRYRKENEDELEEKIEKYTRTHRAEEIVGAMRREGVAAAVLQNGQDLLEKDAQLKYRKTFIEKHHPAMGTCMLQQPPFRFSATSADIGRPPCLGEHTEYVCKNVLGMGDEEYTKFCQNGVFG